MATPPNITVLLPEIASTTVLGEVAVDGVTVNISPAGVISTASSLFLPAQTGNISATTLFTTPNDGIKHSYIIQSALNINTPAKNKSTTPIITIRWAVPLVTASKNLIGSSTSNNATIFFSGSQVILVNPNTAVTVTAADYASSGTTVMSYDLVVVWSRLS